MMRKTYLTVSITALTVVLASTWFVLSQAANPKLSQNVESNQSNASGILDGMTFSGELRPVDGSRRTRDRFGFANGTFVSTECEKRCDYPARPYFVRQNEGRVEFVSETRCPYKDAKIVWRGTVDDGKIKGEGTWTISRWYWTREKKYWFEGTLLKDTPLVASQ